MFAGCGLGGAAAAENGFGPLILGKNFMAFKELNGKKRYLGGMLYF
jgi:hypothetical protein